MSIPMVICSVLVLQRCPSFPVPCLSSGASDTPGIRSGLKEKKGAIKL